MKNKKQRNGKRSIKKDKLGASNHVNNKTIRNQINFGKRLNYSINELAFLSDTSSNKLPQSKEDD